VTSVAFSPDGKTQAAGYKGGDDGDGVVLWDARSRRRLADDPLEFAEGEVTSVAFSPDGKGPRRNSLANCGAGVSPAATGRAGGTPAPQ